jgi:transcriptional antiterminator NusG
MGEPVVGMSNMSETDKNSQEIISSSDDEKEDTSPSTEENVESEEEALAVAEVGSSEVSSEESAVATDEEIDVPAIEEEQTVDEDVVSVEVEEIGDDLPGDELTELDITETVSTDEANLGDEMAEMPPLEDAEEPDDSREAESEVSEEPTPSQAAVKAPIEVPDDGRLWYVVHCYSGYENKVRHNLEQRIDTMGMKSKIFDVVVPTEEEMEIKNGKRRTVERRVFPGYILVQMVMDEDSWYVVRNTPGVTGFVGMGNEPTPLRPEEVSQIVKRMEAEAPRVKVAYKTGEKVRIIDGPFNDFIGTVSDINMERAKVRVRVSFFGRETPVELDLLQVEKA